MDMVFKFRESAGLGGNAQVVGETFHAISKRNGKLTPVLVVDSARSVKSPLHRYFEWNDKKAADEHRKEQARYLISCVVTIEQDGEATRPVRSFVSINHSYEPIEVVMSNAGMREQALQDVRDAIGSLREKLKAFEEFADVLAALEVAERAASRHFKPKKDRRVTATR